MQRFAKIQEKVAQSRSTALFDVLIHEWPVPQRQVVAVVNTQLGAIGAMSLASLYEPYRRFNLNADLLWDLGVLCRISIAAFIHSPFILPFCYRNSSR